MKGRGFTLVVGNGIGGLTTAQAPAGAAIDVTVIDRHCFHDFQPCPTGCPPQHTHPPALCDLAAPNHREIFATEPCAILRLAASAQITSPLPRSETLLAPTGPRRDRLRLIRLHEM
jgi:hypothetical protein